MSKSKILEELKTLEKTKDEGRKIGNYMAEKFKAMMISCSYMGRSNSTLSIVSAKLSLVKNKGQPGARNEKPDCP